AEEPAASFTPATVVEATGKSAAGMAAGVPITPLVTFTYPVPVARLMVLPPVPEKRAISESTELAWPLTSPPPEGVEQLPSYFKYPAVQAVHIPTTSAYASGNLAAGPPL